MVSLANGICTDTLSSDTMVDTANQNQTDTKQINGDVSSEITSSPFCIITSSVSDNEIISEPCFKIVSPFVDGAASSPPYNDEHQSDSREHVESSDIDKNDEQCDVNKEAEQPDIDQENQQPDANEKSQQADVTKIDQLLGVEKEAQKSDTKSDQQPGVDQMDLQPDVSESNTVTSTSNMVNNVVFVSNMNSTVANVDSLKGNKLYVLNGNILKGSTSESTQDDKYNLICVPQVENINDLIRQMEKERPLKSLLTSDLKNFKPMAPARHVVPVKYISVKDIKQDVKLSTPTGKAYEILRNKLMENTTTNGGSPQFVTKEITTTPVIKSVDKNTPAAIAAASSNKESETWEESSAVSEARSEFIKSRRLLIEAAIHPKMPIKRPLLGYSGPTYKCDECDDTFVSPDSLLAHEDRRSVLLTYACPACKATLEFYNRCTFLMHVRSHNISVKACDLTISVIPANKLHFRTLEIGENAATTTDDQSLGRRTTPSAHSQTITGSKRKIMIRSVEKTPESDSRTQKLFKRKKGAPTRPVVQNETQTAFNDNDDERKSSSDSVTDDYNNATAKSETEPQKRMLDTELSSVHCMPKVKKKQRTNHSVKSGVQSKPPPEPNLQDEKPVAVPNVTTATEKNVVRAVKSAVAAAATIEEITLTSSDEEDVTAEADGAAAKVVSCRECQQDVTNLTKHYRGENRPRKEFPCEQCKYFNSSACALSAHVRMHTKSPPFVCPDCGYFFSTLETFLIHVKQVCFYDFKAIRFKCPECSLLKPSVTQFSEHLRREHTRDVFKCDACMTSSYSHKVVEQHIRKVHADKPGSILEGYCCVLCPNLLISKSLLQPHVNKHVYSLQYLRYVYICKMCKKYASGRMSKFAEHYHSCPQLLAETQKSRRVAAAVPARKSFMEPLEKDPLSIEEWEADKLKAEFVPTTKLCVMCRNTNLNEHSSLFCNDCVRYVDAEDASGSGGVGSLDEAAASAEVGRSKRKFKCKLCKQFMNRDWPTITKHFEQFHHSDFDVGTRIRATTTDGGGGSAPSASARKRKPSIKLAEMTVGKSFRYKCVKCGMLTNDRAQFHDHIVSHKSENNKDFQCLECGWCFIVKPSLEKHLIVVHKIRERNLKEYFRENGVQSGDDKGEERSLVENQCEVCYMECGTKQVYDKHIRTHGMAFVAMQSKAKT